MNKKYTFLFLILLLIVGVFGFLVVRGAYFGEKIDITRANHLDSDRVFIENIYDLVKEKDDIWFSVPDTHYIRATFEEELTSENDITLYARGSGTVEVYREESGIKIMQFNIDGEGWYKKYLTDMKGKEDTFDLRFLGEIDVDYIVDPPRTLPSITFNEEPLYIHPIDNDDSITWGPTDTRTEAQDDEDGAKNTDDIVEVLGDWNEGDYAAKLCDDLTDAYGHSDWFLPAKDQLEAMYDQWVDNTLDKGDYEDDGWEDFASEGYWSSTELDSIHARLVNFPNGDLHNIQKNQLFYVRCVRVAADEHTITFQEGNDLDGVNIKIYDDSGRTNEVGDINTSGGGTAEIDLEDGNYWFTASKAGYVNNLDDFEVDGEDRDVNFTMDELHTLTMAEDPAAGGTAIDVTGEGLYVAGTEVDINTTINPGYEFINWTAVPDEGTISDPNTADTTFTMPDQAVTLTANFNTGLLTNTNTADFAENETETTWTFDITEVKLDEGETVTIDLSNALHNDLAYSTTAGDYTVTDFSVNASDAQKGGSEQIVLIADTDIAVGTTVLVSVEGMTAANDNATGLTVGFTRDDTGESDSDTFNILTVYTLTLTQDPDAGASLTGAGDYIEGATVDINATVSSGYEFVNWTDNYNGTLTYTTGDASIANSEIEMPAEDFTLTANFNTGNIENAVNQQINERDDNLTIVFDITEVQLDSGQEIEISGWDDDWKDDGDLADEDFTNTIGLFTTSYDDDTLTLTAISDVAVGTITLTDFIEAGAGFWAELDTSEDHPELTITRTDTNTSDTFEMQFDTERRSSGSARTYYNISFEVIPEEAGNIPFSSGNYSQGTSMTFTAQANEGYVFFHWEEGGEIISERLYHSLTVTRDKELTAVFEVEKTEKEVKELEETDEEDPEKTEEPEETDKEETPKDPIIEVICPSLLFVRDLQFGMVGDDVKALQQYLNNNGFPLAQTGVGSLGNETNYFGSLTRQALINFQEAKQLPVIGTFDLQNRIFLGCFEDEITEIISDVSFIRDLYLGMSGEDVKELQQYLNNNGFPLAQIGVGSLGNETNYFGSLTQQALISFQRANNINPAVGYFGPITRGFVNR